MIKVSHVYYVTVSICKRRNRGETNNITLGALDEKMTKVMRIGGALENKSRELQEKLKTK